MDLQSIDWALIKTFIAVLDQGSITGAARKLGALQPTLSRQIDALEAQFKVALFERTGRGVTPTVAALAIAAAARQMEAGASTVQQVLAGQRTASSGQIRITTSQVAACYLLPPVLGALQRAEPDMQIELVVSNNITNLLRRDADIAVRMVRPQQSSVTAKKLAEVPIVACAHRSYLQRMGVPKQPGDLARHQLIGYDRDHGLIKSFARYGAAIRREHFAMRTDDHIAYGRLVAEGAGIGFVAQYNLRFWPEVVPLLPTLRIPALPCWLAVHREIRGNRFVRRAFDFLAEAIPRELAEGTSSSAV
jgi:DNA-binding transcriptional LysR family regulator